MPPTRKFESGSSKRKRKEKEERFIRSQRGAIDQFIIKQVPEGVTPEANGESVQVEETVIEDNTINVDNVQSNEEHREGVTPEADGEPREQENMPCEDQNIGNLNGNGDDKEDIPVNIYDPKNWDTLDIKWRDLLVKNGPIRDILTGKGPKDGKNRRFCSEFYNKYLPNGEKHHRD